MSKSGAPCRLTVLAAPELKLIDSPVTGVLSQLKEAPPDAVKVSITGPAATKAWAWNGMATDAPGVVVTVAGALSAALDPLTPDFGCDSLPSLPRKTDSPFVSES